MCYWLHHHNIYVKTMLRTKKYNMYYWLHHHSFMWRHWRKPKMTRWTTDCITTTSMWRQCCKPKLTRWTTDCMTTHLCGGNDANQNWQDVPLIAWPLIYVETMLLTKNDKMNHWLHHHNVYVEAMLLTKNDKMNHWLHDHNVYVETMLKTKNDKMNHSLHDHSFMCRQWHKPKMTRCTTDCITTRLCGDDAANKKTIKMFRPMLTLLFHSQPFPTGSPFWHQHQQLLALTLFPH